MRTPTRLVPLLLFLPHVAAPAAVIEPQGRDAQAIAAAIQQSQPGDTVRLPEGTFELAEPIRVTSQRKLIGAGQDKTRLVFTGSKPGVLISLHGCEDVELAHLTLDGQNNPLVHQGIGGGDARRLWLHHLTIRNLKANNTIRDCVQFGAQHQGETGGIAHHYFYRCTFEKTVRGHALARYPNDSGHGFRTNGHCRGLVFEDCTFRDNGGYGVQLGGPHVDALHFRRCEIIGNGLDAVTRPAAYSALEFSDCQVRGNQRDQLPDGKPFSSAAPVAEFQAPEGVQAGQPAQFRCTSRASAGTLVDRLWDFGHGIAEVAAEPLKTFDRPGKYRVTLIVWDGAGRGGRTEKLIEVVP